MARKIDQDKYERRERKKKAKKNKFPQHGYNLWEIYLNAVLKRRKKK